MTRRRNRGSRPPAGQEQAPARQEALPARQEPIVTRGSQRLPPEGGEHAAVVAIEERRYSGPLPPASELVAYNQAHPQAAEIILNQFSEQGAHRRHLEKTIVTGSERRANIGQFLAFGLLGGGFTGGCLVALQEPGAGVGIAAAVASCGAIVYFLGGRPTKADED